MPFCSSTIRRSFALPSYDAVAQMKALNTNIDLVFFRIELYCVGFKQHHNSTCCLLLVVAYALFCANIHNFMRPLIFVLSLFIALFVSNFVLVFVLQLDTMEVDTSEACLLAMLGHLASSEAFTNACFASLCSCRHHDRCDLLLRHHGHSQAL